MGKISAKNKIYGYIILWFILTGSFFGFFVNIFQDGNKTLERSLVEKQVSLQSLQTEQKSYLQGKQDLDKVSKQPVQPDDLFSKDISLVRELENLENLSRLYNVTMELGGINGTIQSVSTIKLNNTIYVVPASAVISGSLDNVVAFMDHIEHLGFATKVTNISINAAADHSITLSFNINFYLKQ